MNLDAAIQAARAESLERSSGPRITRDRVLEACARTPSRRLHAAIAAVIASMFGASAFAWYARTPSPPEPRAAIIAHDEPTTSTEQPTRPLRTIARVERPAVAVEVPEPAPPAVTRARRTSPATPSSDPPASDLPAAPAPMTARSAETAGVPAPVEVPVPDAELALYATAHELHFRTRDLAAAVDAWTRYLDAAPHGKLAPEARYNRVVALVRLARWADAERALRAIDPAFRPQDVERLRAMIRKRAR